VKPMSDIPPCFISIDKEGRWFHKGAEMIQRQIIRLFYEHMSMDPMGRYIIDWAGERCYVEVEDTAFVVRAVTPNGIEGEGLQDLQLLLSDDTIEDLQPETLSIGKEHVLYCRVKGLFPARFSRPAYYQLAAHIEEEAGGYYLLLHGMKYWIRGPQ
jgi:uncharacterized protein